VVFCLVSVDAGQLANGGDDALDGGAHAAGEVEVADAFSSLEPPQERPLIDGAGPGAEGFDQRSPERGSESGTGGDGDVAEALVACGFDPGGLLEAGQGGGAGEDLLVDAVGFQNLFGFAGGIGGEILVADVVFGDDLAGASPRSGVSVGNQPACSQIWRRMAAAEKEPLGPKRCS
jgi:hypothetical protein